MNTSAIPSSAPASNGAMSKPQQSDASSPDVPFNRILTRELADRRAAENTNTPKPKEAGNASQQTEPAKPPTQKSDDDGQSNDTASLSEAENNSTTEQLLMVAAQFSPLNPTAASTIVAQNASTSPTYAAIASATLSTESGNVIKPMQNEASSQIGNPELKSVAQNSELGANPTELKSTSFDAALSQMMDMNEGKEVGITGEKPLHASTLAQQGQTAAKIADSLALAAASQSAANLGADKPIEARPDLSASLAPLQQAIANSAQTPLGHVADRITPHVGTPAWNQSIGQKLVWMIGSDQQSASLTLNPPDLGPLQVVLNVSSTQANASFYSAQPEVREALEAALPKLREMLGEAGIQLGQANVSAGTPQQQGSYSEQQQASRTVNQGSDALLSTTPAAVNTTRITREGMIDTFA